jgi:internalin A
MTLAQIKENLQSLIVEDFGKALEKFKSILDSESDFITPTILHQANYNGLKKEMANDTISESNLNLRRNKIRAGLLGMLNELEEKDVNITAAEAEFRSDKDNPQPVSSPPIDANSGIYISYAWGGESEKIVDLLDGELQERSIKVIRDKRDLGYKGSITEFMKDIGTGNKVIIIISKKYLESENCMFELTQVYENKDFAKRIFPIVLEDADIYKPLNRINYIKYWDGKIQELDQAIKSLERGTDVLDLNRELNNYGKIRMLFSDIAFILKDMNTLSPEIHQGQKFDILYRMLSDA